jgi:hypothetical protein
MSNSVVRRWVRHFNGGRENVHDDPRSGRPSVVMKIWCLQWKRRFNRSDDSPSRHFPCILHKFHWHFFMKFCLKNFVFGNCVHAGCRRCLRMNTKRNKRRGMLSRGVVMLHDNVRPHTAAATQDLIAKFDWEQFDHPPYSPDLAPRDFHMFLHLKTFLVGGGSTTTRSKKPLTRGFHRRRHILRCRGTRTGVPLRELPQQWWKLWCPATRIASTMVETMSKVV